MLPRYTDYYSPLDEEEQEILKDIEYFKIKKTTYSIFRIIYIGFIISALVFCFILGQEYNSCILQKEAIDAGVGGFINHPIDGKKFIFFRR